MDTYRSSARLLFVLGMGSLLVLGVVGCQSAPLTEGADSEVQVADPAVQIAEPPPYQVVLGVRQLMFSILDPAADGIWDSAGTIITAEGSRELAPTTNEGWQAVYADAALLAEAGNLLMIPGRAVDAGWIAHSQDLTQAGRFAMEAASAQDSDALFDAGGQVYQACRGCHEQYWRPTTPVGEALPEPKF